ncbi:MAG: ParB N-terminal domain-containing protein, partial [Proteobacteria bacterium]|nr:ParB N-terminal domain-containing protein [Pseudomonadota bacterium]
MSGKSKKITEIPVSDLVPYAGNPRENDAAVDRMVGSIEAFGFRIPILVRKKEIVGEGPDDPESGIVIEIVDGHLRLKAAEKMGMKTVPTMDASDMTEDQVQAFRIMVNQSVSWAEWNEERLKSELQSIASHLDQNDNEALAR